MNTTFCFSFSDFEVLAHVSANTVANVTLKQREALWKYMAGDKFYINIFLASSKVWPNSLSVSKIGFVNGEITMCFVVKTIAELDLFYKLSTGGTLSQLLTEYSDNHSFPFRADLPTNTKLKFDIKMDDITYSSGKSILNQEEK